MIKRIRTIFVIYLSILIFCTFSTYALEKNKIILFQFGPRNSSDKAIGLYEFSFYNDGLLKTINSYTNTGYSNDPYKWNDIKLRKIDYLDITRTESDIKAIYYENFQSQGEIVKWFTIQNEDNIFEMSPDGQTVIGEVQLDYTTGNYIYFRQNENYGYYHNLSNSEEINRIEDKEKGLFFTSKYTLGKNKGDIILNNISKRFHPRLKSYDDNFQVNYKFDGNIRYTITRTEDDYPADFVDKLDVLTTLDTSKISLIASALNTFLVFSPPIIYYTYLHPFITKRL